MGVLFCVLCSFLGKEGGGGVHEEEDELEGDGTGK